MVEASSVEKKSPYTAASRMIPFCTSSLNWIFPPAKRPILSMVNFGFLPKIRSQLRNCSPAISRMRASSSGVTVYAAVLPFIMCRTMVSLNVSASMGLGRCSEMLVTRSRTDLMLLEVIL